MASSLIPDDCISIRARVRKSRRAIDPEFDACQETLVSFVINNVATAAAAVNDSQSKSNSKMGTSSSRNPHHGGPSLLLTHIPTTTILMTTPRARSLSFSNRSNGGSGSRGLSPVTVNRSLPRRSFGTPTQSSTSASQRQLVETTEGRVDTTSQGDADQNNTDMMMEVSLEDEDNQQLRRTPQSNSDKSLIPSDSNNSKLILGLPPTQPFTSSMQQQNQNQLRRHPSPLVMHRSSSGGASSHTNISTSYSDPQPGGSMLAIRSRSQSRSRSIGNSRRLRSLGAAVVFANATASSSTSLGNSSNSNNNYNNTFLEQETTLAGGQESTGGNKNHHVDPITIPLVDVLGVDEEVPRCSSGGSSSRRRSGSGGGGGGGGGVGSNNSEFYSSAASDIGVAKEAASAAGKALPDSGEHQHPNTLITSTPPVASNSGGGGGGGRPSHRIFLHTLSSGYLEFSLDNANSHDIFMAFLKAHLPSDRIPCRDDNMKNDNNIGSSSHISSSAQTKLTNNVGLLRTMVLTPTKEVPSNLSGNSIITTTSDHYSTSNTKNAAKLQHYHQQQHQHGSSFSPPPTPTIVPSSSASVCSNRIDKLHSKMMHQRLQYEKNNRPPLVRIKERMVNWMSSVVDCGCCLDTTVAPLETTSSSVSGTGTGGATCNDTTPKTKALKKRGIGGLSFEVESCISGSSSPMPNLSFER